jgi:uncharacterized flavoprotein (TIGR03862 family)
MARVRVFGAGPAGLMAAEVLASAGHRVVVRDHHRSPARKFLLAGRGGLNLTHSEPLDQLLERYASDRHFLEPAIRHFPPDALRSWCEGLGVETFVGSSGRVFPKGLKSSPLLRAWLKRLEGLGVTLERGSAWTGFDGSPTVLALGGASWPELGSDAAWTRIFQDAGIKVAPLVASNVRLPVAWSSYFSEKFAGHPIKNVAVTVGTKTLRGELMIAREGIEGGAIYGVSRAVRETGDSTLTIDLKPDLSQDDIHARMKNRKAGESLSNSLRKRINLSPQAIGLMKESGSTSPKQVKLQINGNGDLRRAISTAGGIAKQELAGDFSLLKYPNTFVVGEMLDWDAPTGGYLLQACISTARYAASNMAKQLEI